MLSLHALIFCRECRRSEERNETSLEGVFTRVVASSYPHWQTFDVWLWLVGPPSTSGRLRLTCYRDLVGSPWFRILIDEAFSLGDRDERILVGKLRFCFPGPGRYLFRLTLDDRVVGERVLTCDESWE